MMVNEQGFKLREILELPEIKRIFDDLISEMPVELLETVKTFVENTLSKIIGIDGELEVRIVVDANVVISQTINYIKKDVQPIIVELSKSPFIKVYAPSKIFDDTINDMPKLSKIAKKKKIELDLLKEKLSEVLSCVEILEPKGDKEFEMARQLIGSRDPDDVDYLYLYFSINATGVVTNDNDFENLPKVQKWKNMGPVKELTIILTRGSISFALMTTSGAVIADLLFKIVTAILGVILGILSIVGKNFERLIKWVIDGFSNLPNELKIVVTVALVVLGYGFRREIKEALEKIVVFISEVIEFLRRIGEFISNIVDQINLYSGGKIAKAMESLLIYSAELIQLYEQINWGSQSNREKYNMKY